METKQVVPIEAVSQRIFIICGIKVMLGQHLAGLYGIEVKVLIQAVKRNKDRFPGDFMFQLSSEEFENLKSQFVTSSWGGIRRATPYAFTEHGVAMLSAVLKSPRAIEMSVFIVRAFIRLREMLASDKELGHKVEEIEREQKTQNRHINAIYRILDKLIAEPTRAKEPIGF
jgi:hypothetical protein